MWPNAQFPGDLVTFTEEILENFIFCAVGRVLRIAWTMWKSLRNWWRKTEKHVGIRHRQISILEKRKRLLVKLIQGHLDRWFSENTRWLLKMRFEISVLAVNKYNQKSMIPFILPLHSINNKNKNNK